MAGDAVFAWLTAQPGWQQDLARRVATRVELDDGEYEDSLRMVKARFSVPIEAPSQEASTPVQPVTRTDLQRAASAASVKLLSFGGLHGVGLVSEDDVLSFEPDGITLIYGQNAAGKSSYVGALKTLCRTVDRGCRVRGSIYVAAPVPPPSAHIETSVDGTVRVQRTTLDDSAALRLPGLSVFDSACAELYVNEQNRVQYVPSELRLLTRLAALQDRMRGDLSAQRQALETSAPPLDDYPPTTTVGRLLASLSGADDDPELTTLSTLNREQRARLVDLRAIVTATAASTSRVDALAASRDGDDARALAEAVTALAARAAEPAAARLRRAADANATAQSAVRLAAEEFAGAASGVGTEPWRVLWEAARAFVTEQHGVFPPTEGQPCPLCQQSVTASAAVRLTRFEEHIRSEVRQAASAAAVTLQATLAESNPAHTDSCRVPLLAELRQSNTVLVQSLEVVLDKLAVHLGTMVADPLAAAATTVDATDVVTALLTWGDARDAHAANLLSADDPDALQRAAQELAELEARERLSGTLTTFTSWQTRLRTIRALDEAFSALATNRITKAQRELTESEVAKSLDAALAEELRLLSCTHLPVELSTRPSRTSRADTTVTLRLLASDGTPLAKIVSEGERRALALAFFFAELAIVEDRGGIIVDDPVSSLDDERRRYIADRLVTEACRRQVIVFTHDLAFLLDLQTQALEQKIAVRQQGLWRNGMVVGKVDEDLPFKAMNLRERIGKLRERAAQWDTGTAPADQDEAWNRVTAFYTDLRTSWERAIEERLFKGVVQRFQRSIKTQSLKHIEITPELLEQINKGMTRASTFLHDQPLVGGSTPLPTRRDLESDLEPLVQFEAQVKR